MHLTFNRNATAPGWLY